MDNIFKSQEQRAKRRAKKDNRDTGEESGHGQDENLHKSVKLLLSHLDIHVGSR